MLQGRQLFSFKVNQCLDRENQIPSLLIKSIYYNFLPYVRHKLDNFPPFVKKTKIHTSTGKIPVKMLAYKYASWETSFLL